MTVVGIDPGRRPAFARYEDGTFYRVDFGLSAETAEDSYETPSAYFRYFLDGLKGFAHDADVVVTERQLLRGQFNGGNDMNSVMVREIQAYCDATGKTFLIYSPDTIKKQVTGNGHAKKPAIFAHVKSYLPPSVLTLPKSEANHLWDAVAIVLCAKALGWKHYIAKKATKKTKKLTQKRP